MSRRADTAGSVPSIGTVADAMSAARGAGLGILVDGGGGFVQAFTTPFGPCLRRYEAGEGLGFLARAVRDSARGKFHDRVAVACARQSDADALAASLGLGRARADGDPDAMRAALAAFARRGAEIPSHAGPDGSPRARTSTVAPCPGSTYEHGTELRADARPLSGGGTAVRWVDARGEVGIHLVLDRPIDASEALLVARTRATVVASTPGAMPASGGTRPIQTLVLDVPHAFAEAFADGRMPRHGDIAPDRTRP